MITTKEADDNMKAYWTLNDKYPDYIRCVIYDHKSPPYHDMDLCKEVFTRKIIEASKDKIEKINCDIERAEEEGEFVSELFAQRKKIRNLNSIDLSQCDSIEKLTDLWPKELEEYLKKS